MNVKKLNWLLGSVPASVPADIPSDVSDSTNTTGSNQQVIAIIGDSKANGTSDLVGPTPAANTVYQWNRAGSVQTVTNADLLYVNTFGSQWPRFGIDYYNATGYKPVFVNYGAGGSAFYRTPTSSSWDSGGDLWALAKTQIDACLANLSLTRPKAVMIVMGFNDAQRQDNLATSIAQVPDLISRINTAYGTSTQIYISITGADGSKISIGTAGGLGAIQKAIKALPSTYSNVHVVVNEQMLMSGGLTKDGAHFNYEGNQLFGSLLCNYMVGRATETNKEICRVLYSTFYTSLTTAEKNAYRSFVGSQIIAGNWSKFSSLQIRTAKSRKNVLCDLIGNCLVRDNYFTTVQNTDITFDGSSSYISTGYDNTNVIGAEGQDDVVMGWKTKEANTALNTQAALGGQTTGAYCMIRQNTTSGIDWWINTSSGNKNTYTGDTKLQIGTHYAIQRSAAGACALLKGASGSVQSASTASTAKPTSPIIEGADAAGTTPSDYWSGGTYYFFAAQNTGFNYSNFVSNVDTLITALTASAGTNAFVQAGLDQADVLSYTKPAGATLTALNTLFNSLDPYIMLAESIKIYGLNDASLQNFSTLNLFTPKYNQSLLISTPTYGVHGWKSAGAGKCIDENIRVNRRTGIESDFSSMCSSNSADVSANAFALFGVQATTGAVYVLVKPNNSAGTTLAGGYASADIGAANTASDGFFSMSSNGSSNTRARLGINGSYTNSAQVFVAPTQTYTEYTCAWNFGGAVTAPHTTADIEFRWIGRRVTDAQEAVIRTAVNTFLTAIGL
jgi:hypothetical protein